jgi:hypothetical protein
MWALLLSSWLWLSEGVGLRVTCAVFMAFQGLDSRKNIFPLGCVMVMLQVPLLVVVM